LYQKQADDIERGRLLKTIRAFNDAVNQGRNGWQPQLGLELALMESLKAEEEWGATQHVVSTPSAQPAAPSIEATPPGSPPVIPLQTVRDKWMDMLRALGKLNKTGPDLVQNFRPLKVDGNIVFLGTDNKLYYERLQHPTKIQGVERALSAVHKMQLKINVVMASGGHSGNDTVGMPSSDLPLDDPLLELGRELGAEIKPQESDE